MLALERLNDKKAIPFLKDALEKEKLIDLQKEIKEVIFSLEN